MTKTFLKNNFMLSNQTAVMLYEKYARNLPIVDYHCHIDAKDIANDVRFENITKLWLGGDHYKWRFMRACGIDEKYITGDASDKEKFIKWCEALSSAIGNPLYHWSHLELKKYFGFDSYVTADNAEELWNTLNKKLKDNDMSARSIIKASNVALLCTTDDPTDDLCFHETIKEDSTFETKVLPAFRPDNAMMLKKEGYLDYIAKLEDVSGIKIKSFDDLKKAIISRIDFFDRHGCVLADHGLTQMVCDKYKEDEIEKIFTNRLNGVMPSESECRKFYTAFLLFSFEEYRKRDWTGQLHYGCRRDLNSAMFKLLGPNTGFDSVNPNSGTEYLADFLDALCSKNALPRVIVYSLNPIDNAAIDTVIGAFNDSSAVCKIQHGSAWWFNDHKIGITNHLETLAANGNLAGFVGMLTDSRSFVSYERHDYFRRILCNYVGTLIENGEFPDDETIAGKIISDISYNNAINYFKFK